MYLVSLLCAAHTLHCLAGYFYSPFPQATMFFSLYILKSQDSLRGGSFLGPLGVVVLLWQMKVIRLDLVLFWTSDIQDLPN